MASLRRNPSGSVSVLYRNPGGKQTSMTFTDRKTAKKFKALVDNLGVAAAMAALNNKPEPAGITVAELASLPCGHRLPTGLPTGAGLVPTRWLPVRRATSRSCRGGHRGHSGTQIRAEGRRDGRLTRVSGYRPGSIGAGHRRAACRNRTDDLFITSD